MLLLEGRNQLAEDPVEKQLHERIRAERLPVATHTWEQTRREILTQIDRVRSVANEFLGRELGKKGTNGDGHHGVEGELWKLLGEVEDAVQTAPVPANYDQATDKEVAKFVQLLEYLSTEWQQIHPSLQGISSKIEGVRNQFLELQQKITETSVVVDAESRRLEYLSDPQITRGKSLQREVDKKKTHLAKSIGNGKEKISRWDRRRGQIETQGLDYLNHHSENGNGAVNGNGNGHVDMTALLEQLRGKLDSIDVSNAAIEDPQRRFAEIYASCMARQGIRIKSEKEEKQKVNRGKVDTLLQELVRAQTEIFERATEQAVAEWEKISEQFPDLPAREFSKLFKVIYHDMTAGSGSTLLQRLRKLYVTGQRMGDLDVADTLEYIDELKSKLKQELARVQQALNDNSRLITRLVQEEAVDQNPHRSKKQRVKTSKKLREGDLEREKIRITLDAIANVRFSMTFTNPILTMMHWLKIRGSQNGHAKK